MTIPDLSTNHFLLGFMIVRRATQAHCKLLANQGMYQSDFLNYRLVDVPAITECVRIVPLGMPCNVADKYTVSIMYANEEGGDNSIDIRFRGRWEADVVVDVRGWLLLNRKRPVRIACGGGVEMMNR